MGVSLVVIAICFNFYTSRRFGPDHTSAGRNDSPRNHSRVRTRALQSALACDAVAARRQLLDDTDEFVAYVEMDTIERSSRTAKMWILYDYKFKHTYLKWV